MTTRARFPKISQWIILISTSVFITSIGIAGEITFQDALNYLYEAQDQWHQQFWVFRSQDSGANVLWDGVQDGNGWKDYQVYHNDTSHHAVGLTCIRMEINHPTVGQWIGWHYLFPKGNWNGEVQGYDLRGSGPLTVEAKAHQNGMEVQFRMRCKDQHGTMYWVYPVEADPVDHKITLTDTYQTFHFDFSEIPEDALYSVFELFAVIVPYSYANPSDYVIYLDDISYDLEWQEDPHLLDSIVPKDYEVDYGHMNQAHVYDNDLVGLALLALGTPEARQRARFIAESLLFAMNHSPNQEIRLFNAYRSGMLYDRSTGSVAFPGFWNYQAEPEQWQIDENAINADTGNLCWTILFFLEVYKQFQGTQLAQDALDAARWLGDFIINNLSAPDEKGFLLRMQPSTPGDPTSSYDARSGQSSEMNLDAMVAFHRLHKIDGQTKWLRAALSARDFLLSMVNPAMGVICTGTNPSGDIICEIIAEDVQSWTILATRGSPLENPSFYRRMIKYVENNMLHRRNSDCDYRGFDFSDSDDPDPDGVWFEGGAHMVLAYKAVGMSYKAKFLLSEITRALDEEGEHPEYPLWLGKGVPGACKDYLTTGFGWHYFNRPALAPTAWSLMAKTSCNPLTFHWMP